MTSHQHSSAGLTQTESSQVSVSAGSGDRILGALINNEAEKAEGYPRVLHGSLAHAM